MSMPMTMKNEIKKFVKLQDHKPIIIALSGFKGSGKDTISGYMSNIIDDITHEFVRRQKDPLTYISMAFADPIHNIADEMFRCQTDYNEKELNNAFWSNYFNKPFSQRDALISVGEMFRKTYGPEIWNIHMMHNIIDALKFDLNFQKVICIRDVRFNRELRLLDELKECGFDVRKWVIFRYTKLPEWAKMGLRTDDPVQLKIIEKDFHPVPSEFEWCKHIKNIDSIFRNDPEKDENCDTYIQVDKCLRSILM